jgi:hypothetical protein
VYIDTGSPVLYIPSKSRDVADENNKILTIENDSKQPYCFIIFQYYFMNYYLTTYQRLKILSKQVNLCLYRESQRNQF